MEQDLWEVLWGLVSVVCGRTRSTCVQRVYRSMLMVLGVGRGKRRAGVREGTGQNLRRALNVVSVGRAQSALYRESSLCARL